MGSTLSLVGMCRLGATLSLLDCSVLGSTLAMRSFVRIGASVSVLDFSHIGASMSLRGFARFGSSISLLGVTRLGSSLSVCAHVYLGAALSLRSCARMSSSLSVLDFSHLGASVSLRSLFRLGRQLSVFGTGRFGSTLSVMDVCHLGSSLSLRSFSRLGASLSILDCASLGSTLSMRSFARIAGAFVSTGNLAFSNAPDHYITGATGTSDYILFVANATDSVRATSTGGVLHGTWTTDVDLSTSDRRLKENIRPLHERFEAANMEAEKQAEVSGQPAANSGGMSAMLRELRPVSYTYRKGEDSEEFKQTRFGFVADEIKRVLPEVTRTLDDEDQTQSIVYQDFIAVLTAMIQGLAKDMSMMAPRMESVEMRIAQRKRWKQERRRAAQAWAQSRAAGSAAWGSSAASWATV